MVADSSADLRAHEGDECINSDLMPDLPLFAPHCYHPAPYEVRWHPTKPMSKPVLTVDGPIPDDWAKWSDDSKVAWPDGHADPYALTVSLGLILTGNIALYGQLQYAGESDREIRKEEGSPHSGNGDVRRAKARPSSRFRRRRPPCSTLTRKPSTKRPTT